MSLSRCTACSLTVRAEIVFRATNDLGLFGRLSHKVLQTVQDAWSLDTNPIFAILHEALYCQGCASSPCACSPRMPY